MYGIVVEEREATRAARGAEAWIHGGIVVQVPAPQLLFVYLSSPHRRILTKMLPISEKSADGGDGNSIGGDDGSHGGDESPERVM